MWVWLCGGCVATPTQEVTCVDGAVEWPCGIVYSIYGHVDAMCCGMGCELVDFQWPIDIPVIGGVHEVQDGTLRVWRGSSPSGPASSLLYS